MGIFSITSDDVRAARALLQWSQSELSKQAGVGVSTIADLEKGARQPIASNLNALRQAFEAAGIVFTPGGPTTFAHFSLHLMIAGGMKELAFRYSLNNAEPVLDTVSVFGTEKDGTINIELAQQATAELKSAVENLVQRHSDVQQLKQLRKAITDLPDGQYFLVLPAAPSSTADKLQLESYLAQLNDPDAVPEASIEDLFGPLLAYYDMSMPRTDRNTVIGGGNKTCRFCQRTTEQGATFKKAAHVIPMALGNSFLKSDQECDDCNAYFGSHTEPSLIAMLDVERVFLGIQGRAKNDGRPMLAFGNDKISHDGEKMVIHAHSVSQDSPGTFEINLGKGHPFVPLAVYRALVKIAVSVVSEAHLKHLKRSIDWVRHGLPVGQPLPLVATTLVDLPPNPSGQITVYERKQPHSKLPHLVGEFRLGCYLFVFAVPFSDADDWNLVGFFDDADFGAHFKHYAAVPQWRHRDLSSTTQISLAPQLRFSPRVGGAAKTASE